MISEPGVEAVPVVSEPPEGGFRSAFDLALARLGGRFFAVSLGASTLLTVVAARLELMSGALHAVDNVLLGALFGMALPLLTCAVVGRLCLGRRLDESLLELARYGVSRRALLLVFALVAAGLSALMFAALAALGVGVASREVVGAELLTCSWIGALGGAVYASLFVGASMFGSQGRGRWWCLVADWILGSGVHLGALPWPRAHLRSLLGDAPVFNMQGWQASVSLVSIACIALFLAYLRTPK